MPLAMPTGERGTIAVTAMLTDAHANDTVPSCQSDDSVDVVYAFVLTAAARVTVDLRGSGPAGLGDTVVYLRRACWEPELQCNDDFGGLDHSRVVGVFGPGAYHVFVDGFGGATGAYVLSILFADP